MANRRTRKKTDSKSEILPQEIVSFRESNLSTMLPLNLTFLAITEDAFHFKVTAGVLCDNIKTGCFKVSSKGLSLKGMNTRGSLLIKLLMKSTSFHRYEYSNPSPSVLLGLNITHFNRMLRSIKKKDTLQLAVDGDADLKIRTHPKDNSRITTSILKIQRVQQVRIAVPFGDYGNSAIVSSSEFNKMIKDFNNINPLLRIYFTTGYIKFECGDGNVLHRTVEFGENSHGKELHMQEYDTEQLFRICKVSAMNNRMQIFTAVDMPLYIKTLIGSTGDAHISLYIKNNEMMKLSSTS
jgi:DNA polymerase III sliding clamp (beta) subunit (PCNA family)